jgi:hypothetical protein
VSEDLEGQARENRDNGGRGRLAQARKFKWSTVIGLSISAVEVSVSCRRRQQRRKTTEKGCEE